MPHCVLLNSGALLDFLDPHSCPFTIGDIANGTASIGRFGGQLDVERWYSVAQHSVNASYIVEASFELEALLHDGTEGLGYGDMVTHLKALCLDYKALLKQGEYAVADRFDLPREMSPEVKLADLQMLRLEKTALHPAALENGFELIAGIDVGNLEHLVDLTPWSPRYAKHRFLERFEELTA